MEDLFRRRADAIGNALLPTVDREDTMDTLVVVEKCLTTGLHAHIIMFITKHSLSTLTIYISIYHIIHVGMH